MTVYDLIQSHEQRYGDDVKLSDIVVDLSDIAVKCRKLSDFSVPSPSRRPPLTFTKRSLQLLALLSREIP